MVGKDVETDLDIGTVIELSEHTRRQFLKGIVTVGASTVALNQAIESVTGQEPEGVPLVLTRDRRGNPDRVKIVPERRHRRLKFHRRNVADLMDQHSAVEQVSMVEFSDSGELALELRISPNATEESRRTIPEEFNGIPVVVGEAHEHGEDSCNDGWDDVTVDPLEGNASVLEYGTICVVGYDESESYEPATLTCRHVWADVGYPTTLTQDGRDVGNIDAAGSAMDWAKFELTTTDYDSGTTASSELPDIRGTWDYEGLVEETAGINTVAAEMAGRSTCHTSNKCGGAYYDRRLEYQAEFLARRASGGDSGAPWVDDDGYLVCMHQGYTGDEDKDRGAVGTELFDAAGFALYPPMP